MKTTIRFTKVFQSPPLKDVRMITSETVEGDGVDRMNQLAAYTVDNPYVGADELHTLKWFANGISLESQP